MESEFKNYRNYFYQCHYKSLGRSITQYR